MTKPVVIVGGGLAGVTAAIELHHEGRQVSIYESNQNLGGLLGGLKIAGDEYPFGTHLLQKSGRIEIDNIIFPDNFNWHRLEYVKNGNITNNKLDTETGFLNLGAMPIETQVSVYQHILHCLVMKNRAEAYSEAKRLDKKLVSLYGENLASFYEKISEVIFGLSCNLQDSTSLDPVLCTNRIKAFTPWLSRILKRKSFFDNRFSFHSSSEGVESYSSFVPTHLEYINWWKEVEVSLRDLGIDIFLSSKCEFIDHKLHVQSNTKIMDVIALESVDVIRTAGLTQKQRSNVQTELYFYKSSHKPLIDSYFITSYSSTCAFSRITLCANLGAKHNGIVAEVISPASRKESQQEIARNIGAQLKGYGIVNENSIIELMKVINLKSGGFRPKLFNKYLDLYSSDDRDIRGIASNKSWFMNDVIRKKHKQ